ncbi:hypothetical protein [Ramlibacter sp.]|uniref:hypothetical protein n=1 Tax=Ramlibacter sp. TaxID=1917967 RepID=UPI0035B39646
MSPYTFINDFLGSDAAKAGGVVRRKKAHIDAQGLYSFLLDEVKKRGFHLLEAGDQYIVICGAGPITIHV